MRCFIISWIFIVLTFPNHLRQLACFTHSVLAVPNSRYYFILCDKVPCSDLICLISLYRPVHLSAIFLFFQCLSLVVFFLTSNQSDINFCTSVWVDEYQCGYNGESHLLGSLLKFAYLTFCEKQFAIAFSFVVWERTVEIGWNIHSLNPQFAIVDIAKTVYQRGFSQADRLYFCSC